MRKSILAVAAAISMISVSGGAAAQSAAALSLSPSVRAGADMQDANAYRGGFIIPTLAILGIIALVYVLTKGDNASSP